MGINGGINCYAPKGCVATNNNPAVLAEASTRMSASNGWIARAMAAKDDKYFKELGARLAAARKRAGLTQLELAEKVGVAQQTLAHYETSYLRPPILVLIAMSDLLGFSLEEMLTGRAPGRAKRGPASKLEQRLEAIGRLPKSKQRAIGQMLDAMIAQQRSS